MKIWTYEFSDRRDDVNQSDPIPRFRLENQVAVVTSGSRGIRYAKTVSAKSGLFSSRERLNRDGVADTSAPYTETEL
jgi:hypothetical protein